MRALGGGEAGTTTIGVVVLMLALTTAGAGVSYTTLAQSEDSVAQVDQVIGEAIDNSTEMAFVGSVVYVSDNNADGVVDENDSITFVVTPAPGAAIDPAGLLVSVRTSDSRDATPFAINYLRGDGDALIEADDVVELTVSPTRQIAAGDEFTIELQYGSGPTTSSARTMPVAVDGLMALY